MISKATTVKNIQDKISGKDFKEAVKYIEKNKKDLIEIDYWYFLALCSRYQEKYKEALVILNKILRIDSSFAISIMLFRFAIPISSIKFLIEVGVYPLLLMPDRVGIRGSSQLSTNLSSTSFFNFLFDMTV